MLFYEYIGLVGVSLIIIAFFAIQTSKMTSDSLSYLLLNLFGSSMIMFTVFYDWNLSTFTIEFFWIAISLYGIYKKYSKITN